MGISTEVIIIVVLCVVMVLCFTVILFLTRYLKRSAVNPAAGAADLHYDAQSTPRLHRSFLKDTPRAASAFSTGSSHTLRSLGGRSLDGGEEGGPEYTERYVGAPVDELANNWLLDAEAERWEDAGATVGLQHVPVVADPRLAQQARREGVLRAAMDRFDGGGGVGSTRGRPVRWSDQHGDDTAVGAESAAAAVARYADAGTALDAMRRPVDVMYLIVDRPHPRLRAPHGVQASSAARP